MLSGKFEGLENQHGIFWGLIFGPGIFGALLEDQGILPPFDHTRHLKSGVSPGIWSMRS